MLKKLFIPTIVVFFVSSFIFFSCHQKKKEYLYKRAYIYSVSPVHMGGGWFKLHVKYRFEYNHVVYDHSYNYKLGKLYNRWQYHEGDSLMIRFPEGKPDKSEGIEPLPSRRYN